MAHDTEGLYKRFCFKDEDEMSRWVEPEKVAT